MNCFSSFGPFSGGWVKFVSYFLHRSLLGSTSLSLQVSAAIYEHFPDCSLFCRLKVFACPAAKHFLAAWPNLVKGAEHKLEKEMAISSTFFETNTQMAFMSLAAGQKGFEAVLRAQTAQLDTLTRRTEPLSPTQKRRGVATTSCTPAREGSEDSELHNESGLDLTLPARSLPPCTHYGHCTSPAGGIRGINGPLRPPLSTQSLCIPSSASGVMGTYASGPSSLPSGPPPSVNTEATKVPLCPIFNHTDRAPGPPTMTSLLLRSTTRVVTSKFCGSLLDLPLPQLPLKLSSPPSLHSTMGSTTTNLKVLHPNTQGFAR